jgi:glutaminase
MGIAAFSPRLDAQGNSVRGVKACQELSERFGLHLFGAHHSGRAVIRSETTLATRSSIHVRPSADAHRLKSAGSTARVVELQGNLHFSAMEIVQRRIWEALDETDIIVLDFSRVDSVDAAAAEGAARLAARLADYGRQIVFVALAADSEIPPLLEVLCPSAVHFADLEQAIDVCERSILGGFSVHSNGKPPTGASSTSVPEHATPATLTVAELEVAADLEASELRRLESFLTLRRLDAGHSICRRGDHAGHVFFLARGSVSVRLYHGDGTFQPLAVFAPGSVFGEMAIIDGGRRSADVWTETPAEFYACPSRISRLLMPPRRR